MKRITNLRRIVLGCAICLVAITSCKKMDETSARETFDMVATQKAIDKCNIAFMEAFNKGDSVGVANCYVSDAKLMPPNVSAKEGKSAIQTEIGSYFKSGIVKLNIISTGLWGDENMLVEENKWIISDKDGNELDHGKSLAVYKKEGDSWKLFRDCFNSDMPCAPASVPAKENK